jgi:sugar lactone lactonase YvrE
LRKRIAITLAVTAIAAVGAGGALGVSGTDTITTIAGGNPRANIGDGGPATSARLSLPYGVAVDGKENVYIADFRNARVRKVTPNGTITTFAGGGNLPGDGGPATSAQLVQVKAVAVDAQGNVYIADQWTGRVRKVTPDGTITTFAGGGSARAPGWGDGGPATSAVLNGGPAAVAVDGQGNVYIAEDARVRKVNPSGTITTIAGTVRGFSGDGGPATSAKLFWPRGLAVDGQGNVYIADTANHRVRKVSSSGTITTVAGTGTSSFSGDGGPAISAQLGSSAGGVSQGLAVDGQGNLYIADTTNDRVRRVTPDGTITTVAGTTRGFSGDGGPAISAKLNWPAGLAVDRQGSLYVADYGNNRVRKIGRVPVAPAPSLTLGGAPSQSLLAQSAITVTAECNTPCSLSAVGSVTVVGTKYVFGLTRANASRAAGQRTLALRCTTAQRNRFRKLLKPGQQARAVITVKATSTAGRTTTSKRTVAVR